MITFLTITLTVVNLFAYTESNIEETKDTLIYTYEIAEEQEEDFLNNLATTVTKDKTTAHLVDKSKSGGNKLYTTERSFSDSKILEKNSTEYILSQISQEYSYNSEDNFKGTLILDNESIQVREIKGDLYEYKVSLTKKYENFNRNDLDSIPKTIKENVQTEAAEEMKLLVEIIRAVRNIRSEVNTPMSKKINLMLKAKDESIVAKLEKNGAYLERFCNPEELTIGVNVEGPAQAMTAVVTGVELILPLKGLINIEDEIKRLDKECEKLNKEVERVQKKLGNEGFVKKAPAAVIEEERAKEQDYVEKRDAVISRIQELKQL